MRQLEVGKGGLIARLMVAKSPPEPNRARAESHPGRAVRGESPAAQRDMDKRYPGAAVADLPG